MKETRGTRGNIQHEEREVEKKRLEHGRYSEFLRQEVEKAELNKKQYEVQDKIQEVKTMLEQDKKMDEK